MHPIAFEDYYRPQARPGFGSLGASLSPRVDWTAALITAADRSARYVPVWRPPPPMPSERPEPLPPVPQPVQAEPIEALEDEDVSHTWGHVFREAAGGIIGALGGGSVVPDYSGAFGMGGSTPAVDMPTSTELSVPVTGGLGPESCEGMIWTGGAPPRGYKVVNWCGKGVLRKVRRRRRKRILTASDSADIATIVGLVGKGQMASALINRTRT